MFVTRNIREILIKMTEIDEDFKTLSNKFIKGYLTKKEFSDKVMSHIFNIILCTWVNNTCNLEHLPFLAFGTLMEKLNKIEISSKNLYQFVEWYFEEFVQFYTNKENKQQFVSEIICFNKIASKSLNKYSMISQEISIQFIDYAKQSKEKIEKDFDRMSDIACVMLKTKEKKGTSYSLQHEMLKMFGLSESLQVKLLYENVFASSPKKEVEVEEKIKEVLTFSTNRKEQEKTLEEKKDNKRKKELRFQLKKYFNPDTLTNEVLIDNDIQKEVFAILNELYSIEEVAQIKACIFENNRLIKQKLFLEAKEELLENPNRDIYELLNSLLYQENGEFKMYSSMIKNAILEINSLLSEYSTLSFEDKKELKEIYTEQLDLIFKTLEEYGLNLIEILENFNFCKSEARK